MERHPALPAFQGRPALRSSPEAVRDLAPVPQKVDGLPIRHSRAGWGRWALRGAGLFAVALYLGLGQGINRADEAWFLQVATRVAGGEVLYRDVWFGATPLSVWLAAAMVRVAGAEVFVVKALVAGSLGAVALLSWRMVPRLGLGRGRGRDLTPLFLLLALAAYAVPRPSAAYTPLAMAAFMATFAAALEMGTRRDPEWLRDVLLGGVAAGVCFAAKQNLGMLAMGALVIATAWAPGSWLVRLKGVTVAGGAFGVVLAVLALGAALSGGLSGLLEYGFLGKGTYLETGGVSYGDGLAQAFTAVGSGDGWTAYRYSAFLVPPLTLAAVAVALIAAPSGERRRAGTVLVFVAAGLAGLFPRADLQHLTYVMPAALWGLAYAWGRARGESVRTWRWAGAARMAGLVWLAIGVAVSAVGPVVRVASDEWVVASSPHVRGAVERTDVLQHDREAAEALRRQAPRPVFVLSAKAGYLYLLSGLQNPTPFDYPLVSVLGTEGQDAVVQAIRAGDVASVCLRPDMLGGRALRPERLVNYVFGQLERGPRLGECAIYS